MISSSQYNLKVYPSVSELNKGAAEFIIAIASKSIAERGRFIISLSGGLTPQKLYALLAELPYREQINWMQTFIFWGDERCVSLNDNRNNAHMAKKILLDKVNIPNSKIHPIPVYLPPAEAAATYEKGLKDFFKDEAPQFDLILLGLGVNGHTASLFPETKVIDDRAEGVRQVYVEEEREFRISMTAPLINRARRILFLVSGDNKAEILKKVLTAPYQPDKFPAQLIKPKDGELCWYVDDSAASLIAIEN